MNCHVPHDYGSIQVYCASSLKIMRVPQAISQLFGTLHSRTLEVIYKSLSDNAAYRNEKLLTVPNIPTPLEAANCQNHIRSDKITVFQCAMKAFHPLSV